MISTMRERMSAKLGNKNDNAFRMRKLFKMYDKTDSGMVSHCTCSCDSCHQHRVLDAISAHSEYYSTGSTCLASCFTFRCTSHHDSGCPATTLVVQQQLAACANRAWAEVGRCTLCSVQCHWQHRTAHEVWLFSPRAGLTGQTLLKAVPLGVLCTADPLRGLQELL